MRKGKRHESLIPLSREHQYGLLVCLRIHNGIEKHKTDGDWLSERARKASLFFENDLRTHFKVEEEIVFPAMGKIEEVESTIKQLKDEHKDLKQLIHSLREARGQQLAALLREFADLLESHIRKEERVLFPSYEQNMSAEETEQVKTQVLKSLGTALKPKHPELLE